MSSCRAPSCPHTTQLTHKPLTPKQIHTHTGVNNAYPEFGKCDPDRILSTCRVKFTRDFWTDAQGNQRDDGQMDDSGHGVLKLQHQLFSQSGRQCLY